jgi:PAS domain S-box-containing protein
MFYSVARDGRQKKTQEAKINEVNKKLIDVLENTGDGFASISNDYKITYWNKLAERYSGLARNEVIGRDIREIAFAYPGSKFYPELERVMMERKNTRFSEYFPDLNYWYSTSIYPTEYGLSIFVRNITKEKQGMQLFEASHERYQLLFKASNDAIYDWDIQSDGLMFGDGYTKNFGYSSGENLPIGEWSSKIHPDDIEKVENELECVLVNKDIDVWKEEYRFRRQNGDYAYVFDLGHIIRNTEGVATRMVGSMRDVTEDKKYEKTLEELNAELADKAKELSHSNEELERFAYVASHDLQEPLRMVTSFLQLLEKRYNDLLDDKGRQYIHFAVDGASRMKEVLVDLLEYSRIGRENEKVKEVDLNEVLARVLRNLKESLEAKPGAKIEIDDLPTISGNKTEMIQLFQNLLSNALKYQSKKPPAIAVLNRSTDTDYVIGVQDNGIGIDKLYYDKIFIIFQRLHSGKSFSGTGIGLAICKKIVDNLEGKIWVESSLGLGSIFWIKLPK